MYPIKSLRVLIEHTEESSSVPIPKNALAYNFGEFMGIFIEYS